MASRNHRLSVIYGIILLFLVSCTEQALETEINNIGSIEGKVASSNAALVTNVGSLSCSSWIAHLYELTGVDGTWAASPLLTTPVNENGQFKFERLSSVNVRLKDLQNLKYVIVLEGCDKKFRRLITSAKNQNVTPVSDLIHRSFDLLSRHGRDLGDISLRDVHDLMTDLEAFEMSTLYDVYTKLTTDSAFTTRFGAIFGFSPTELQNLPPQIRMGTNPTLVAEDTPENFLLSLNHWHPGYPKRALWYAGSTYLGEGETASLSFNKNLQGSRSITVTAGFSTGPTSIDLAKPYSQETVTVTVSNDFPAVPPVLARTAPAGAIVTTRNITLEIATGASLVNCETFSKMALTEESLVPPFSPTAYTLNCTTAPSQSLSYTLNSTGDGSKNLSLWAMDSSGNISPASTLLVALDETAPNAPTITRLSPALSNSLTVQIQNADCNGSATHILFSESSTTPSLSDLNWQACVAGNYNFNIAAGDGVKTIYAFLKDSAGHISSPGNVTMTLDQTLPAVTLTGAPTASQRLQGGSTTTLTWTASDTHLAATPVTIQISSNGGTSWSDLVSPLVNDGTESWTVPSYTGSNFKVRIKVVDQAGNHGYSTGSPTFAIDSNAPNVLLTSLTGGQLLKGGSTVAITWTASDDQLASNPIQLELSSNGGSTWASIASNLANSGSYNWLVPMTDGNNFKIRVIASDAVGMVGSSQSSSSVTIDATTPTVNLLSLTGGQIIPGFQSRTISWTASDARLTSNPIAIEYSANAGSTWTSIASGLANTGSYSWNTAVADGTQYRIRIKALDQAGNEGIGASASNFEVSSAAPNLTQTTAPDSIVSRTISQVTYGGNCETGYNVVVSGSESATVSCPAGTWSWTTAVYATDGIRNFAFSQTNVATITTTVSAIWNRDTVAPVLSSIVINSGDAQTPSPLMNVQVTSPEGQIEIRLSLAEAGTGDCQTKYADNNWITHSSLIVTHLFTTPVGDGLKKICAWAKDAAGNISVIAPVTGTAGVNFDTINLETGTPPQITSFTVVNDDTGLLNHNLGDRLRISWTITDAEGLSNNPVTLDYTTDGGVNWSPIVTNYGGLSGNPLTYTHSYLAFNAPTTSAFRVRIRAMDTAQNTASPILSNIQNGGQWSIYAGSTDMGIGGDAKSLRLQSEYGDQFNLFDVDPLNGDLYMIINRFAVVRVDRSSGISSVFLSNGTLNLPDDGAIPTQPRAPIYGYNRILFDKNGRLYLTVSTGGDPNGSMAVYQFDLVQNRVRKYLSGGTVNDGTATPANAFVAWPGIAFDGSNSLYFYSHCTPGSFTASTTMRILKVTQNSNGTAGTVSVVGGNCIKGTPTAGLSAVTQPISNSGTNAIRFHGYIAVNPSGSTVVYRLNGDNVARKIINGVLYNSNISGTTSASRIDSVTGKLLQSINGEVISWTIDTTASNGDTPSTLVTSTGTDPDCWNDGKPALQACVSSSTGAFIGPDRMVYFLDNLPNVGGFYRIRYIDGNNTIRTAAGGKPIHGEGLLRNLVKVDFNGIYYKSNTEPNQTAFPSGLYFMSLAGGVFGYLDDNTPLGIVWGNQKAETAVHWPNGTPISSQLSIGIPNGGDANYPLSFDSEGLPWLKLNDALYAVNSFKQVVRKSDKSLPGYISRWDDASPGSDPRYFGVSPYGAGKNLVLKKNQGPFLIGRYYSPPSILDQGPILRFHDFNSNQIQHIMGTAAGVTSTADSVSPGSLETASILTAACVNSSPYCAVQFEENDPATVADDVLYFVERFSIRKIINPLTPASHELKTIVTVPTYAIGNFILSLDKKYIFYLANNELYCHSITLADEKTWCRNNPALRTSLGPPAGTNRIQYGPNQLTWRSPTQLLISNYSGEIYEYTLPP